MQLTTCSCPVGGLVLMRFDPQMWHGAGINPPWGPLVVSPCRLGLSRWPLPPVSPCRAETQGTLRSCRGVGAGPGGGCGGRRGLSESFLQAQNGKTRPGKITLRLDYFELHQETEKLKCAPRQGCRSDRADANTISRESPWAPRPAELRTRCIQLSIWSSEAKDGPDTQ